MSFSTPSSLYGFGTKVAVAAICLILGISSGAFGQFESYCETGAYSAYNIGALPEKHPGHGSLPPLYLRLYFHVIKNELGVLSQSKETIDQVVYDLNKDFNPHNIFFAAECEIDEIPGGVVGVKYYHGEFCDFIDVNRHADGIDIYLSPTEDYLSSARG